MERAFEIDESPVVQSSEIVKDEKGAYFLFKYARIHAGEPNPRNGDLLRTAIFYFDGETEKTKLVYANNKGEQIGSYSVSKQEIYILRNDGIYSIDFTGKNEKKLYDLQVDEDNFAGFVFLDDFVGNGNKFFSAEVSVCFEKKYWGSFVRYCSKIFFKMCFDVFGFYKIKAQFYPQNRFAQRLITDCGFEYEVTLPKETLRQGQIQNIVVCSLYRKYYYN